MDPSSVTEMSAPAQPPTEGAEGTAPGGGPPGPPPNTTSNRRLQQTQAQVEEVVDIMRVNVDKVLKRDEILSQLDDRADALQVGASQFESSAAKLKRKYWWKNCKMMIMLGAICAIIVVVIVTHKQKEAEARPGWVWMFTFHAAAFHCAEPCFLSLRPCFPHSLRPAPGQGRRAGRKQSVYPPNGPPRRSPLSSGLLLA
ncbi:vesicle-associated membrane protein 1 isoform X2 [Canis lupus baileyi]|uniref:vesicle-associated membrane protein 1 isoform X1 n=1 Tax=Canis lupus dingo TaxID=286419 RepID=UPI0015F12C43|nr:vesicle-associated membrane protein 1 isoform X1 [Canis lupus dingo]XP_038295143.1 vesicle-associated membrane protein 1 isoform X2 [Canis lupus familiaris]XP_038315666.1 vesicle-associated membrane protein 1 isoform X2 [Canis lupus familiaris]XP_038432497.1 vesicle-associated membrane protein 1 isoform X2 [Canis lupus familiaris]